MNNEAEQTTTATQIVRQSLTAETTYTVKVKATATGYTDSDWATITVTTDAKASVEGIVEGIYQMVVGTDDNNQDVYNEIAVSKVEGNDYTVYNIFGLPEYCYATYDKNAGTLTLSGISNDNAGGGDIQFFGSLPYNFNEDGTMVCGIISFMDLNDEEADGTDPWILKVNDEGYLYETVGNIYFGVASFDPNKGEIIEVLGNAGKVLDGSTVEYVGPMPSSRPMNQSQQKQKVAMAMNFSSVLNMLDFTR